MAKFPTFIAGTFYVANWCGDKMAGGKDFPTMEAAIKAAQSTIRRSLSSARAHGTVGVDVMEVTPGRHITRAAVNPDLTVEVRA